MIISVLAKRERYRSDDFGGGYDERYRSGINRLNTTVERSWIARNLGAWNSAGRGRGHRTFQRLAGRP